MKKLNISILGIIGILVLVVFASGCTSSSNNTTMANSSSSNGQSASSTGSPMVKVSGSAGWSGDITDNSGSRTVSGTGSQTFPLSQDPGNVVTTIQKDNSKDAVDANGTITPNTSTLTVQIVDQNGNVVATQSTSADAGVVSVSHSF